MLLKRHLLYLWNGGLDVNSAEPGELREMRTISSTIFLLALVGLLVMTINTFRNLHGDNPKIAAALVFSVIALHIQARWNAPKLAANMTVLAFWTMLVLIMLTSGILGQTWIWLLAAPGIATLLAGIKSGVFWTAVCALTIWAFTALQFAGKLTLDAQVQVIDSNYVLGLASEGTLVLVVLCISVLIFRHSQNSAEDKLKETVLSLETEVHNRILAEEKARVSEQSKSTFLAVMSHELRTPMNGVIGAIRLLLESDVESEKTEYANIARESGETLFELVNSIMDLSSLESGSVVLEKISIDLTDLITKTMTPFRFQAKKKGLEIIVNIDEPTPNRIIGDPTRLRQILINLVGNALKFTDSGEVRVQVCVQNETLNIVVSDSGIGIAEKAQTSLFDPYVQADSSTTRKFGGYGLGLSIVKKLITEMAGSISVSSVLGEGTQFDISIPIEVSDCEPETAEGVTQGKITPLKILVADDNAVNRLVLSRLLEKDRHLVVSVINGLEAVDYVKSHEVDVVLMDVQMPELDGIAATRIIRNLENAKSTTPVIAITANTSSKEVERIVAAGMNGYFAKPFRYEDIQKALSPIQPAINN